MSLKNKCDVHSIHYLFSMCFYFLLEVHLLSFFSKMTVAAIYACLNSSHWTMYSYKTIQQPVACSNPSVLLILKIWRLQSCSVSGLVRRSRQDNKSTFHRHRNINTPRSSMDCPCVHMCSPQLVTELLYGLILDSGETTCYKHRYHLQYNHENPHEQFKTNVSQSLTV